MANYKIATPPRERKSNALLNSAALLPRKSCDHKELRETPMEERDLAKKPMFKVQNDRKFATSYDKEEAKTSRKRLYHEIKGCHQQDQVKIGIVAPTALPNVPNNPRFLNARYEENRKSFLNIFGYTPNFE